MSLTVIDGQVRHALSPKMKKIWHISKMLNKRSVSSDELFKLLLSQPNKRVLIILCTGIFQ